MPALPRRSDRRHDGDRKDQRDPFQRDRDRILYTQAFRRLAGITQVVHASEGQVFHNRLTHTLEVGQIAQRLAEDLIWRQPDEAAHYGISDEVVQAAAWAHDLGHPPFGHIGEEALDDVMRAQVSDGFEGNAQSFRIVTKLTLRKRETPGLNLTRASLNAILKYPKYRDLPAAHHQKFGAYRLESDDFEFARALQPGSPFKSADAEIMDWADDIGYAVHDLEDFYRAGLIPLDRIFDPRGRELDRFLDRVFQNFEVPNEDQAEYIDDFVALVQTIGPSITDPYDGSLSQRAALRSLTSLLIGRYVTGPAVPGEEGGPPPPFRLAEPVDGERMVVIRPKAKRELAMMKRLVWEYVILNPRLASQQVGQRKILTTLYEAFRDSAQDHGTLLSRGMLELLKVEQEAADGDAEREAMCARVAADAICRLTEPEALRLYHRISGVSYGSILDAIVY